MSSMGVCRNCTERKIGCHSTCEEYIDEAYQARQITKKKQQQNNYTSVAAQAAYKRLLMGGKKRI